MAPPARADLTIEAVANRVGMTVRNIRAYQSRGLVPPPVLRGRTGYYSEEHVERLEMIRQLQNEGFRLEAIERFLKDSHAKREQVLGLTRAARQPFGDAEPREVEARELMASWRTDKQVLTRAVQAGFLDEIDDDRYLERNPGLTDAVSRLAGAGVDADAAIAVFEGVGRYAAEIAEAYVALFVDQIWRPFEAAGRPEERLADITQTLEEVRPVAFESLAALFGQAMSTATARTLTDEVQKIDERR
jgi:DNA-binding transcriptional MerR regulator